MNKHIPAEGEVVDVGKGGHEDLAVKPVHDPTVTWNQVSKVLGEECSHMTWARGEGRGYMCAFKSAKTLTLTQICFYAQYISRACAYMYIP